MAVLLTMAALPARGAEPPLVLPQSLSPCVSVASYGADGDPAKDATEAIEQALARAAQLANRPATSGTPSTAVVKFPGGVYSVSRPLFVPSGVDIQGDGWASRIEVAGMKRLPALVYGIADPGTEAQDRPELFGVLDAVAAPVPGFRRGWSTVGGRALQGQFTSANIGRWYDGARDYWQNVSHFSLDICLVRPSGGWRPATPIVGCGQSVNINRPQPWAVWTSPLEGFILLTLADDRAGADGLGTIGVAMPMPDTPVVRLSWEVDLEHGVATTWANGIQVAMIADGLLPGHTLRANDSWPLHVGRQGFAVATSVEPPTPFTLAGLRLGTAPRYMVGRPGDLQRRRDGGAVDDYYRYFDRTDQRTTVGFFPFDDPPTQRWLRWTPGDGLDEVVFVMKGGQGGSKPARLKDLAVWSRGPAVLLGAVLDWYGANLRLQSETAAAVGSVPMVMSYPITLLNSTLSGGDAALSVSQALAVLRDCKIEGQGRDGIRLRGASLDASHTFAAFAAPQAKTFLRSSPGGEGDVVIRLDRLILDYEDRGVDEALIAVRAEPQYPTTLRITDLSAALTGPDARNPRPVVQLSGSPSLAGISAIAEIQRVVTGGTSAVVAGGEGWQIRSSEGPIMPKP